MEQMGSFQDEKVLLGNQMQMQLAGMHGEDMGDFIDKHAEEFRNVVTQNPELLDEFKRDPEAALSKLSQRIYH